MNDRPPSDRPLHVLVVDDSALVRQAMSSLITEAQGMSVRVAADPLIAMRKMAQQRPDVIVLDLEMPRMDGLSFLRKIMASDPIPVVICSSYAARGTRNALRALEHGAVEVLAKPKLGLRGFSQQAATEMLDTIRAAAQAQLRPRAPAPVSPPAPRFTADAVLSPKAGAPREIAGEVIVAIGASTGGPEALRQLLEVLPEETPGIVIVQHMPEPFTTTFAERLNRRCRIEVREAAEGDRVLRGRALIAPGNRHTMVVAAGNGYRIEVAEGPLVCRHRPSVDVLFRSVAQAAGARSVGVIMTGMGDDGATGIVEMKRAGAATIAQDEATCIVFGMPREAIARGGVDTVVPLGELPAVILSRAYGKR